MATANNIFFRLNAGDDKEALFYLKTINGLGISTPSAVALMKSIVLICHQHISIAEAEESDVPKIKDVLVSWDELIVHMENTNNKRDKSNSSVRVGTSKASIYRSIKILSDIGLVEREEIETGTLYNLDFDNIDYNQLGELKEKTSRTGGGGSSQTAITLLPQQILRDPSSAQSIMTRFWSGLVPSGYLSGKGDKRTSTETIVMYGDGKVKIHITSNPEVGICIAEDVHVQFLISAFCSGMIAQWRKDGEEIKNDFLLDLNLMAQQANMKKPSGINRSYLLEAIKRLYHTDIEITPIEDGIFKQHIKQFASGDFAHERFITSLAGAAARGDDSDDDEIKQLHADEQTTWTKTRYVRISLNKKLFNHLVEGQTFVAHNSMLRYENRGNLQLLYQYLRIRVRDLFNEVEIGFSEIQKRIAMTDRKNFARDFLRCMSAHAELTGQPWDRSLEKTGGNTITYYGFVLQHCKSKRRYDPHRLLVSIDRSDYLIGEDSANRRHQARRDHDRISAPAQIALLDIESGHSNRAKLEETYEIEDAEVYEEMGGHS